VQFAVPAVRRVSSPKLLKKEKSDIKNGAILFFRADHSDGNLQLKRRQARSWKKTVMNAIQSGDLNN
jgi:hypothetical protein